MCPFVTLPSSRPFEHTGKPVLLFTLLVERRCVVLLDNLLVRFANPRECDIMVVLGFLDPVLHMCEHPLNAGMIRSEAFELQPIPSRKHVKGMLGSRSPCNPRPILADDVKECTQFDELDCFGVLHVQVDQWVHFEQVFATYP